MFMFLDVFPSLPVRFVSRQEFFWRFGDEPFSRSFFLDGGIILYEAIEYTMLYIKIVNEQKH